MADKKTLILGATPDTSRYANFAATRLVERGHNIDTITLYVGPQNQPPLYDYILSTNPKRIIFNPGTENTELRRKANEKGIETAYACTLVMLSVGEY
jgi:predicted CoA-binding protein